MSTDLTVRESGADIVEAVVMKGDLSKLTPAERVSYYQHTCRSLGLNPLTRPFDYISLSGKLTLYAKRDAADQLRRIHSISIPRLDREQDGDLYVVTAYARTADGREDSDMGAVCTTGLRGEALANAMLKAVTKAKRRATLSICGLGWLDETEIASIPDARPVVVAETGEIIEQAPQPAPAAPRQYADDRSRDMAAAHATMHELGIDTRDRAYVRWLAARYATRRPLKSLSEMTAQECTRFREGMGTVTPAEARHYRDVYEAERAADEARLAAINAGAPVAAEAPLAGDVVTDDDPDAHAFDD